MCVCVCVCLCVCVCVCVCVLELIKYSPRELFGYSLNIFKGRIHLDI